MKSNHDNYGRVKIEFDSQCESILSPCKSFKLLPCDICGKLEWKSLNVVSFVCCPACSKVADYMSCGFSKEDAILVIKENESAYGVS